MSLRRWQYASKRKVLANIDIGWVPSSPIGSIVSLICDAGERYGDTLFDAAWQRENGIAEGAARRVLLDGAAIDALESVPAGA